MNKDMSLVVSIVAPLKNDGERLAAFLEPLGPLLAEHYAFYEVVLVDDGSTDATSTLVTGLLRRFDRVRYLQLTRPFGREVAIAAGLESAIGDFVVTVLPGTDPVALIPELVERCRRGSGILCGVTAQSRHRGWLGRTLATLFHRYCRRYLGFDYQENSTDFRVLSRQAVNAVMQIKDHHRHLRVFTATLGYNQEYFQYEPLPSTRPPERESLVKNLNTAIEIAIANSRHPLRIVSRIGLLMSALNFLYLFYIVAIFLFKKDVAKGWTTESFQQTIMFFFVFLLLAVLCEYTGRILEETQDRPLYFVAHEKTSSVMLESSIEKNIVNQSA